MLEDPLADAILAGELQTDEEITIKVEEEKLIFA